MKRTTVVFSQDQTTSLFHVVIFFLSTITVLHLYLPEHLSLFHVRNSYLVSFKSGHCWDKSRQGPAGKIRKKKEQRVEKQKKISVALPDRPSQAIHYSPNASRCQLYYCEAVPDWRPGVGGEKWQRKCCWVPERNEGRGSDGCVCLTQRRVSSRWDRKSAASLPLCPEHSSLVRMSGFMLNRPCQCFYQRCQDRQSPYSTDGAGSHFMGILNHSWTLRWVWDGPGVSVRADTRHHSTVVTKITTGNISISVIYII